MPTIQLNIYIKDEEYPNFLNFKSKIQEEVKQIVKEIINSKRNNKSGQ